MSLIPTSIFKTRESVVEINALNTEDLSPAIWSGGDSSLNNCEDSLAVETNKTRMGIGLCHTLKET
jgi:hypothetical protein